MRPRRNFGDLARLAETPATTAAPDHDEDSGLIHLATLEAEECAAPSASAPGRRGAPQIGPVNHSRWRPVLAGVAVFGVFAVGALAGSLRSTSVRDATSSDPRVLPPGLKPAAPIERTPTGATVESVELPLAPAAADAREMAPAAAPEAPPRPSRPERSPLLEAPRSSARAPAPSSNPPAKASEEATAADAGAEPATPRSAQSLLDQMTQAAGGEGSSPATSSESAAPSNPDGIAPAYPSLGAINSALGRALQEAQSCVEGDVPISHAKVKFASTGAVEAVTVAGWAAGKPAEACIRDALTKPRVAPFLQPSYVVPVTIRSN